LNAHYASGGAQGKRICPQKRNAAAARRNTFREF
jgi:hypothetical protein